MGAWIFAEAAKWFRSIFSLLMSYGIVIGTMSYDSSHATHYSRSLQNWSVTASQAIIDFLDKVAPGIGSAAFWVLDPKTVLVSGLFLFSRVVILSLALYGVVALWRGLTGGRRAL